MFKPAHICIRTPEEIKAALMRAAAAEQRTLTEIIERLLVPYLKAKGYLTK